MHTFSVVSVYVVLFFFFAINGREGGGEGRRRAGGIVKMKIRCRRIYGQRILCTLTHTCTLHTHT